MAEQYDMRKAREVFNTLVRMLDSIGWRYDNHEEDLLIKSGVKGDDLPIEFIVVVKPKQEVVQFLSRLPFDMPEEKRVEGAIAVCVANYNMVDGSFDYDISKGTITFRMTSSYRESSLGQELFKYMIMCAAGTIDNYNDKFFMISKGTLTLDQFIDQENS